MCVSKTHPGQNCRKNHPKKKKKKVRRKRNSKGGREIAKIGVKWRLWFAGCRSRREARKAEQKHKGQLWKARQRKWSLRRSLKVESEALSLSGEESNVNPTADWIDMDVKHKLNVFTFNAWEIRAGWLMSREVEIRPWLWGYKLSQHHMAISFEAQDLSSSLG